MHEIAGDRYLSVGQMSVELERKFQRNSETDPIRMGRVLFCYFVCASHFPVRFGQKFTASTVGPNLKKKIPEYASSFVVA